MSNKHLRVVVADDEPAIVETLREHLSKIATKFGDRVEVFPAGSASEVLNILSKQEIDVLFLDYHFEGGMNGDEIIDQLEDPFDEKLVILMSARDQSELESLVIKRHKELGPRFKFLRKPFEPIELQDRYLEIEQFYLSRPYPFPLAYARDALCASTTFQGKLTALKDMVEVFTKFSVAMLVADCDRLSVLGGLRLRLGSNVGMTLGAWLRWLSKLMEIMRDRQSSAFMPELVSLILEEDSDDGWLKFIYRFKDEIRDLELGHGYAKEEGWYRSLVEKYGTQIAKLFRNCSFTSRYLLFTVESIDFGAHEGSEYVYQARALMGASSAFSLITVRSSERLVRGQVYLRSRLDAFLCLHPMVVYRVCETCSLGRVYFLESGAQTQLSYNTFCNHRFTVKNSLRDQDPRLSKLTTVLFSSE